MVEQEIYLRYKFNDKNTLRFYLLWAHWGVTFLLSINIILWYRLYLWLLKTEGRFYAWDGLLISCLLKPMCYEILINWIGPVPYFYKDTYHDLYDGQISKIRTYVNSLLLSVWMLIRTYHIVIVMLENSYFMSSRAFRMWQNMGTTCTYKFAIRSLYRDYSVLLVGIATLIAVLMFGYILRIIEEPIYGLYPGASKFSLSNSIWSAIITMSTVGYGDIFPHSGTAKYLGLLSSFVGILLTASFLVAFGEFLSFSTSESISFQLITNVDRRDELKSKARKHIVTYFNNYTRDYIKNKSQNKKRPAWYRRIFWKWRYLSRWKYRYYFKQFKNYKNDFNTNWAQSITEEELQRKIVVDSYKGKDKFFTNNRFKNLQKSKSSVAILRW